MTLTELVEVLEEIKSRGHGNLDVFMETEMPEEFEEVGANAYQSFEDVKLICDEDTGVPKFVAIMRDEMEADEDED